MSTEPRTTAELLAEAELEPADNATSDRLAAIRGEADADGLHVEVNVHGALSGLRIDQQAMGQAPHRLAARIAELATEATRSATAEALALLYWAGGPALAAHLASAYQPNEPVVPVRAPEPPEPDTFEPTSWAVSY